METFSESVTSQRGGGLVLTRNSEILSESFTNNDISNFKETSANLSSLPELISLAGHWTSLDTRLRSTKRCSAPG